MVIAVRNVIPQVKRRYVLLAFSCLILIGLIWHRGPWFHGRSIHFWISQIRTDNPDRRVEAREAIREIGTNALPAILQTLRSEDGIVLRLGLRFIDLEELGMRAGARYRREWAVEALRVLGEDAKMILPILTNLVIDPVFADQVPYGLACLGPEGINALARALTSANLNWNTKYNIIYALASVRADSKVVVTALAKCLDDPDINVRKAARRALENIEQ